MLSVIKYFSGSISIFEANNHIEAPKERVPVPSPTGTYIVLHRAAITVGPGLTSEMTERRIEPNQIIEIVEVKHAETRIRGRMKECGWVSLASNDENEWIWATPYDGKIIPNDPKVSYAIKQSFILILFLFRH